MQASETNFSTESSFTIVRYVIETLFELIKPVVTEKRNKISKFHMNQNQYHFLDFSEK